jgi:hypothetical protein
MRRRLVSLWQAIVPPRVPEIAPFEPQPFDGTQQWFVGDLDQVVAIQVGCPAPPQAAPRGTGLAAARREPQPTGVARLARNPIVAGSSVALLGLVVALLLGLGRGEAMPPAMIDPGSAAPAHTPAIAAAAPARLAGALSPSVEALFRGGKSKGKRSASKAHSTRKRRTTARRKSDIGPL